MNREILKEESEKAVARGNKCNGFLGIPCEELTKEELIMLCNILHDNYQLIRITYLEYSKTFL